MKIKMPTNSLAIGFLISLITACMPVFPPPLPLYEPPTVLGEGCSVTVIRASQWLGAGPTHYISLDGINVAGLEIGDYTRFLIQPGHHTIGLSWRIGGVRYVGLFYFIPFIGETPEVRNPPEFSKRIELECQSGENYSLGIEVKAIARDEDRVEFQELTVLRDDSQLEGKSFVAPGERGKNRLKD